MKAKFWKSGALAILLGCLSIGNAVNVSATEAAFPYAFNFALGTPASTHHITQTMSVYGSASEYAKAYCTYFTYSGNLPVLTVQSVSATYPTYSVSFTSTSGVGRDMRYYSAIPPTNKAVKFQGKVTEYSTSFTISAKVRG